MERKYGLLLEKEKNITDKVVGGGDALGGWSNIKNQVGSVHRIAIYMYKNCVFLGFGYFLREKTSKKRSFFTVCCELEA